MRHARLQHLADSSTLLVQEDKERGIGARHVRFLGVLDYDLGFLVSLFWVTSVEEEEEEDASGSGIGVVLLLDCCCFELLVGWFIWWKWAWELEALMG
ncbi:hypothetical protein KY284_016991 [Solanum tuberosum]|nr:hypothetical protein KY284_016991 [Solanum tuberosum]